jgi:spermidine/putrescine transport system permease protein
MRSAWQSRRRARQAAWLGLNYAIPGLLIVLPLVAFLFHSLFYVESDRIIYQLTLRNYVRFFHDEIYLPLFIKTVMLALEVVAITLLIGYPCAYFLAGLRGRVKYVLALVMALPLFMSYIIKIYAIRSILGTNGFINNALMGLGVIDRPSDLFIFNFTAVLITLSVILLPFTTLPIFVGLERIPRQLLDAAADLGARRLYTFRRIELPMTLPSIVTGAMFTFVLAVGDFVTPEMVGGTTGFTYGRVVFSQFGMAYNWPFGAALSVILLIVVLGAIALSAFAGRQRGGSR